MNLLKSPDLDGARIPTIKIEFSRLTTFLLTFVVKWYKSEIEVRPRFIS